MTQTVKEWAEEQVKQEEVYVYHPRVKELLIAAAEYWGKRAFEAGNRGVCGKCGDMNCGHNPYPSDFDDWWQSVMPSEAASGAQRPGQSVRGEK